MNRYAARCCNCRQPGKPIVHTPMTERQGEGQLEETVDRDNFLMHHSLECVLAGTPALADTRLAGMRFVADAHSVGCAARPAVALHRQLAWQPAPAAVAAAYRGHRWLVVPRSLQYSAASQRTRKESVAQASRRPACRSLRQALRVDAH